MKSSALVVLCAALLITGCGSPAPATVASSTTSSTTSIAVDEGPAVLAVYDTYTKASRVKDGATAQSVLADTVSFYYDDVRGQALSGREETVNALRMTQRMLVYSFRAEYEPATLRATTGAELIKVAIDMGLISLNSMESMSLGPVSVTGDKASAEIFWQDRATPYELLFARQGGGWKLDLTPLLSMVDDLFVQLAEDQGTTVNAMADTILEARYGAARVAELRQPLEG